MPRHDNDSASSARGVRTDSYLACNFVPVKNFSNKVKIYSPNSTAIETACPD